MAAAQRALCKISGVPVYTPDLEEGRSDPMIGSFKLRRSMGRISTDYQCLGLENGSALEGTLTTRRCSFQSRLYSRFSTLREGETDGINSPLTRIRVLSQSNRPIISQKLGRADGDCSSYPNPFPCSFIPRDKGAQELIHYSCLYHGALIHDVSLDFYRGRPLRGLSVR